jgi:dolichyl-diphosphooligosaccharide--protein glycosyltransferase
MKMMNWMKIFKNRKIKNLYHSSFKDPFAFSLSLDFANFVHKGYSMPKVKEYFSNLGDKVKTSVRVKPEAPFFYLSLVLIVIIGVLIRLSPVVQGTVLLKEFDVWIQYNSVQYIVGNGLYDWMNYKDFQMWYPDGYQRSVLRPGLLFSAAILYQIVVALGIDITLIEFVFLWPAIMGGITILVMYFLGKEIMDRRTGLIAATFLALSPGSMQRTVAGFFDNETVGVLAVLLTFLFYLKTVKSGKISHGIIAGLSLGFLCLTWGGLTYPLLLIPLLTLVLILADRYSNRAFIAYVMTMGIGLLIFTVNPYFPWETNIKEMDFIVPALFFVFLLIYHFLYMQKGTKEYEFILTFIKWASIPVGIAAVVIFFAKPDWIPFGLAGRLASIINPEIREKFNIVASVGEHMPSPWSVFYYNSLIPILLIIPGVFFAIRRSEEQDLLMIIFVVTLFYFTGSMVRIILLFAPAAALIGAFGLNNVLKYFGNLMKKEQTFTRRRRRQLKRTIGISEGLVVYTFIAVLLFTQANHAITISSRQLGYSELVAGGTFHDWEETLAWMRNNLAATTVVVSWWDYGYWMRVIGNVTTVNDNGTINSTRIGITGMAMMQTNERYSAEIFRNLGADYVVVYFGHLYSQLGGDEGKWPWMLRICNDHTSIYKEMGFEKENWYGGENRTVDTVFDEDQYINGTSGQYRQKWFDSTIVKLMFADEPTSVQYARTQTEYYYASQIEGSSEYGITARKTDDGRKWSEVIPANGAYDLQFFKPAYYSTNKLVKVFKVDYTALDSSFEIVNTSLDLSGIGNAKVKNTGNTAIELEKLTVNGVDLNMTLQGSQSIKPNETKAIWFNTYESNLTKTWTSTTTYSVQLDVKAQNSDGSSYTFSNSSTPTQVKNEIYQSNIKIDRSKSLLQIKEDETSGTMVIGYINVQNLGTQLTKITNFSINVPVPITDVSNPNGNTFLIAPGESENFAVRSTIGAAMNLSTDVNVTVLSAESGKDETTLAYNQVDNKISILPNNLEIFSDLKYQFDYDVDRMRNYSTIRDTMPINDQSVLWDDGRLKITIKNEGNNTIAIQGLLVDDKVVSDFIVDNGKYFPSPGEISIIRANLTGIELNKPVKIFVLADGGDNKTFVASDSTFMVPRKEGASLSILNGTNFLTAGYTNETARILVKNTGNQVFDLQSVFINNTKYDLSASNIFNGSLQLAPAELSLIYLNFTNIKVNLTNSIHMVVSTSIANVNCSLETLARLPSFNPLGFIARPDRENPKPNDGFSDKTGGTTANLHVVTQLFVFHNLTIDGIYIGTTNNTSGMTLVDFANVTIKDLNGTAIAGNTLDYTLRGTALYPVFTFDIKVQLNQNDVVWVVINTVEGYQAVVMITIP